MSLTRIPLHWRVTLAYTTLGAVLSVLFAAATLYIAEDYEEVIATEMLRGLAEDYGERLPHAPGTELPRSGNFTAYLQRPGEPPSVPEALAKLPPGVHEAENEVEDGMHIGVFDVPAGRLYISIDLRNIEQLEEYLDRFLITVIVLGTVLSAWLGWLLARGTIAPVRKLARSVAALDVRPVRTGLASGMAADDLARLAQSIDGYQARLVEASARESAFFADASHELRTPIAVVRGTAELLLDEARQDASLQGPLRRLDRGLQLLTDLLDVLLGLARHRVLEHAPVDPLELLAEGVGSLTLAECGVGVDVEISATAEVDPHASIQVARHESVLLLRSLLRSLLPPDTRGTLLLQRHARGFELSFAPSSGPVAAGWGSPCKRSDSGQCLTLVGRLADHLHWQVSSTVAGERQIIDITLPST